MTKTLTEAALTTRAARGRLETGLYWRSLAPDVHLGYRKGTRSGRWLVRWRSGKGYEQATFASADDALDADGIATLSFDQAKRKARSHVEAVRAKAAMEAAGAPQTVARACEAYADALEARMAEDGRRASRDCRSRLRLHVSNDDFGNIELRQIRSQDIAGWRERVRAKGLAPATLKRISNDLRAALNEVARIARDALPDRFTLEVKEGFAVGTSDRAPVATRPNVILPDADVRRIIASAREIDAEQEWDGDLARIVIALAATGARFSQLARCTVSDLQTDTKRLMVPVSAKGRGKKARMLVAVPIGDDVVAELRRAVAGRRGHELLFLRWGFKHEGSIRWQRDRRRPWEPAELTKPFSAIVERAELSADVTAYALRHSSIVRGLRAGLPVRLVAALHDTSSEMIERHYSAYIVDGLSDAARAAVVPLAEAAAVMPIRQGNHT